MAEVQKQFSSFYHYYYNPFATSSSCLLVETLQIISHQGRDY